MRRKLRSLRNGDAMGTGNCYRPSPLPRLHPSVESTALAVSGGGATGAWSGALPSLPKGCRSPAARTPGRAVAGARDCERENEGEGWQCQRASGPESGRGLVLVGARRGPPVLGLLEPRLLPLKATGWPRCSAAGALQGRARLISDHLIMQGGGVLWAGRGGLPAPFTIRGGRTGGRAD